MNLYLLLSKTDDECDRVLADLTRFSVRTTGCFAAYAAVSVASIDEARELTERVAEACPGEVEVLVSAEPDGDAQQYAMSGGTPTHCIDRETGQINWDCLGSPEPSLGPKMEFFAVAEVRVSRGDRKIVHAEVGATGGVTGLARLVDPSRLLVEVGATDRELLSQALDAIGAISSASAVRCAAAVRPLKVARDESA